jgi:putative ABC transport system substrate-binding protein
MKRRQFITLIGAGAASWPLAARGQQSAMPLIGYLHPGTSDDGGIGVTAFRKGLGEAGFVEGRNVAIDYRFGGNQTEPLPGLAAELVRRGDAAIWPLSVEHRTPGGRGPYRHT